MMKRTDIRRMKSQGGFTLFELVISITTLAITIGGLAYQLNNAMVTAHRPIESIQALYLAKESVELAMIGQYRNNGSKGTAVKPSAETPMAEFPQYNRIVTVAPYGAPECIAGDPGDCVDFTVIISDSTTNRTIRRMNVRFPLP